MEQGQIIGIYTVILSIVSGLLYLAIRALVSTYQKKVSKNISAVKELCLTKLEVLSKSVDELKRSTAVDDKTLSERIVEVQKNLDSLKDDSICKVDFYREVSTIGETVKDLKESIQVIDQITRQQERVLAKIEASIDALVVV